MVNDHPKIKILANYKDFTPPAWVPEAISRLLDGVPDQYLNGLKIISLSDTGGLNHRQRRQTTLARGRKVAIRNCRGYYCQKWQGKPARIELFIDKILQPWPGFILKIPFCQDVALAEVLYHELGHHIHITCAPEYKEREDVAEEWRKRLWNLYFFKAYWYLKPLSYLIRLVTCLSRIIRRTQANTNMRD